MIDKTIKEQFEEFKKSNPDKYFEIVGGFGPCGAFSDARYWITELDGENGEPIHKVAGIDVNDLMGDYKIKIEYREKWYPEFKVHAENIADALGKESNYEVIITDFIKKAGD